MGFAPLRGAMPVGDRRSAVACRLREWLCAGFAGLRPAVPVSAPRHYAERRAGKGTPTSGRHSPPQAGGREGPRVAPPAWKGGAALTSAGPGVIGQQVWRPPPLPGGVSLLRAFCGGRYAAEREKRTGSELRSLPSISGESVKGGYPLSASDKSELAAARLRPPPQGVSTGAKRRAVLGRGPVTIEPERAVLIHAMEASKDHSPGMPSAKNATGSELCSLPSISGESVKGGYPLSPSTMTNRNLPPRACGAQGSFDFRREAPGGSWTGPRRNRA